MKTFIMLVSILLTGWGLYAQPIPLEGMVGNRYAWYQQLVSRQFSATPQVGFFHVSSMHLYYDPQQPDELMSQSYLTFRLTKSIAAAAGVFYTNNSGFQPSLALQIMKQTKDFTLFVVPRINTVRNATYELMVMSEYRPALGDRIQLYSRFQAMSSYGPITHNRSYQNLRVGLGVKSTQFGIGFNLDEYGPEIKPAYNVGIFLRKELK